MPVPHLSENNSAFREIVSLVRAIYLKDPDFCTRVKKTNDPEIYRNLQFEEMRAMIDVAVAKVYQLTKEDFEYILDQFHISNVKKESELTQQKRLILMKFNEG